MNCLKRLRKFFSSIVVVTFFVTNTLTPAPLAQAQTVENLSKFFSENSFRIPAEFGKVTEIIPQPDSGSLLIHIQEAHANYDAQKNIKNILQGLTKDYGIKLILLEGAGNKLTPEIFNFFPKDAELQRAVNDKLMQAGELTGAEVVLIDQDSATRNAQRATDGKNSLSVDRSTLRAPEAWGVENAAAYAKDREAYREVHENRKTLDGFLEGYYLAWQKQASLEMNKDLRELLGQFTNFEEGRLPLTEWLETLKVAAKVCLTEQDSATRNAQRATAEHKNGTRDGKESTLSVARSLLRVPVDLTDVRAQLEWPVLVRYFRLRSLEGKINFARAEQEKEAFLEDISAQIRSLKSEILNKSKIQNPNIPNKNAANFGHSDLNINSEFGILNSELKPGEKSEIVKEVEAVFASAKKGSLPLYKTRFAFERLMDALPKDFSFDAYPNLRLQIQQMILMSELQGDMLQSEIKELTKRLVTAMAKTDDEKQLATALREYRLLTKLFHLELSREEYQQVKSRGITPDGLVRGTGNGKRETQSFPGSRSTQAAPTGAQRSPFPVSREIEVLFSTALDFYSGAIEREDFMMQRAREVMQERKETRAVLITGGFHTDGFKQKALALGSSYIGITPNIGEIRAEDRKNYIRALLGAPGHQVARAPSHQDEKQFGDMVTLKQGDQISHAAAIPLADRDFFDQTGSRDIFNNRLSLVRSEARQVIASLRSEQRGTLFEQLGQKLDEAFGAEKVSPTSATRSEARAPADFKEIMERLSRQTAGKTLAKDYAQMTLSADGFYYMDDLYTGSQFTPRYRGTFSPESGWWAVDFQTYGRTIRYSLSPNATIDVRSDESRADAPKPFRSVRNESPFVDVIIDSVGRLRVVVRDWFMEEFERSEMFRSGFGWLRHYGPLISETEVKLDEVTISDFRKVGNLKRLKRQIDDRTLRVSSDEVLTILKRDGTRFQSTLAQLSEERDREIYTIFIRSEMRAAQPNIEALVRELLPESGPGPANFKEWAVRLKKLQDSGILPRDFDVTFASPSPLRRRGEQMTIANKDRPGNASHLEVKDPKDVSRIATLILRETAYDFFLENYGVNKMPLQELLQLRSENEPSQASLVWSLNQMVEAGLLDPRFSFGPGRGETVLVKFKGLPKTETAQDGTAASIAAAIQSIQASQTTLQRFQRLVAALVLAGVILALSGIVRFVVSHPVSKKISESRSGNESVYSMHAGGPGGYLFEGRALIRLNSTAQDETRVWTAEFEIMAKRDALNMVQSRDGKSTTLLPGEKAKLSLRVGDALRLSTAAVPEAMDLTPVKITPKDADIRYRIIPPKPSSRSEMRLQAFTQRETSVVLATRGLLAQGGVTLRMNDHFEFTAALGKQYDNLRTIRITIDYHLGGGLFKAPSKEVWAREVAVANEMPVDPEHLAYLLNAIMRQISPRDDYIFARKPSPEGPNERQKGALDRVVDAEVVNAHHSLDGWHRLKRWLAQNPRDAILHGYVVRLIPAVVTPDKPEGPFDIKDLNIQFDSKTSTITVWANPLKIRDNAITESINAVIAREVGSSVPKAGDPASPSTVILSRIRPDHAFLMDFKSIADRANWLVRPLGGGTHAPSFPHSPVMNDIGVDRLSDTLAVVRTRALNNAQDLTFYVKIKPGQGAQFVLGEYLRFVEIKMAGQDPLVREPDNELFRQFAAVFADARKKAGFLGVGRQLLTAGELGAEGAAVPEIVRSEARHKLGFSSVRSGDGAAYSRDADKAPQFRWKWLSGSWLQRLYPFISLLFPGMWPTPIGTAPIFRTTILPFPTLARLPKNLWRTLLPETTLPHPLSILQGMRVFAGLTGLASEIPPFAKGRVRGRYFFSNATGFERVVLWKLLGREFAGDIFYSAMEVRDRLRRRKNRAGMTAAELIHSKLNAQGQISEEVIRAILEETDPYYQAGQRRAPTAILTWFYNGEARGVPADDLRAQLRAGILQAFASVEMILKTEFDENIKIPLSISPRFPDRTSAKAQPPSPTEEVARSEMRTEEQVEIVAYGTTVPLTREGARGTLASDLKQAAQAQPPKKVVFRWTSNDARYDEVLRALGFVPELSRDEAIKARGRNEASQASELVKRGQIDQMVLAGRELTLTFHSGESLVLHLRASLEAQEAGKNVFTSTFRQFVKGKSAAGDLQAGRQALTTAFLKADLLLPENNSPLLLEFSLPEDGTAKATLIRALVGSDPALTADLLNATLLSEAGYRAYQAEQSRLADEAAKRQRAIEKEHEKTAREAKEQLERTQAEAFRLAQEKEAAQRRFQRALKRGVLVTLTAGVLGGVFWGASVLKSRWQAYRAGQEIAAKADAVARNYLRKVTRVTSESEKAPAVDIAPDFLARFDQNLDHYGELMQKIGRGIHANQPLSAEDRIRYWMACDLYDELDLLFQYDPSQDSPLREMALQFEKNILKLNAVDLTKILDTILPGTYALNAKLQGQRQMLGILSLNLINGLDRAGIAADRVKAKEYLESHEAEVQRYIALHNQHVDTLQEGQPRHLLIFAKTGLISQRLLDAAFPQLERAIQRRTALLRIYPDLMGEFDPLPFLMQKHDTYLELPPRISPKNPAATNRPAGKRSEARGIKPGARKAEDFRRLMAKFFCEPEIRATPLRPGSRTRSSEGGRLEMRATEFKEPGDIDLVDPIQITRVGQDQIRIVIREYGIWEGDPRDLETPGPDIIIPQSDLAGQKQPPLVRKGRPLIEFLSKEVRLKAEGTTEKVASDKWETKYTGKITIGDEKFDLKQLSDADLDRLKNTILREQKIISKASVMKLPGGRPAETGALTSAAENAEPRSAIQAGQRRVFISVAPARAGKQGAEEVSLEQQINSAITQLDSLIVAQKISKSDIFKQVISFGNITDPERERIKEILRAYYGTTIPPPVTSFIEQSPADGSKFAMEIYAASNSITNEGEPRQGRAASNAVDNKGVKIHRIDEHIALVEDSDKFEVYVGGITADGSLSDAYRQSLDVMGKMRISIQKANKKLKQLGGKTVDQGQMLRTWFYVDHIVGFDKNGLQRYRQLNDARFDHFTNLAVGWIYGVFSKLKALFPQYSKKFQEKEEAWVDGAVRLRQNGLVKRLIPSIPFGRGLIQGASWWNPFWPASTGIGMLRGTLVMEGLAFVPKRGGVSAVRLQSAWQIDPFAYDPQFLIGGTKPPLWSRAMTLLTGRSKKAVPDHEMITVSGTASTLGQKVMHVGNAEKQAAFMAESVRLMITQRGGDLRDVPQLRVYVKYPWDYGIIKQVLEKRFPGIPILFTISDVCRTDWLVEIEAFAFVPEKRAAVPIAPVRNKMGLKEYLKKDESAFVSPFIQVMEKRVKNILRSKDPRDPRFDLIASSEAGEIWDKVRSSPGVREAFQKIDDARDTDAFATALREARRILDAEFLKYKKRSTDPQNAAVLKSLVRVRQSFDVAVHRTMRRLKPKGVIEATAGFLREEADEKGIFGLLPLRAKNAARTLDEALESVKRGDLEKAAKLIDPEVSELDQAIHSPSKSLLLRQAQKDQLVRLRDLLLATRLMILPASVVSVDKPQRSEMRLKQVHAERVDRERRQERLVAAIRLEVRDKILDLANHLKQTLKLVQDARVQESAAGVVGILQNIAGVESISYMKFQSSVTDLKINLRKIAGDPAAAMKNAVRWSAVWKIDLDQAEAIMKSLNTLDQWTSEKEKQLSEEGRPKIQRRPATDSRNPSRPVRQARQKLGKIRLTATEIKGIRTWIKKLSPETSPHPSVVQMFREMTRGRGVSETRSWRKQHRALMLVNRVLKDLIPAYEDYDRKWGRVKSKDWSVYDAIRILIRKAGLNRLIENRYREFQTSGKVRSEMRTDDRKPDRSAAERAKITARALAEGKATLSTEHILTVKGASGSLLPGKGQRRSQDQGLASVSGGSLLGSIIEKGLAQRPPPDQEEAGQKEAPDQMSDESGVGEARLRSEARIFGGKMTRRRMIFRSAAGAVGLGLLAAEVFAGESVSEKESSGLSGSLLPEWQAWEKALRMVREKTKKSRPEQTHEELFNASHGFKDPEFAQATGALTARIKRLDSQDPQAAARFRDKIKKQALNLHDLAGALAAVKLLALLEDAGLFETARGDVERRYLQGWFEKQTPLWKRGRKADHWRLLFLVSLREFVKARGDEKNGTIGIPEVMRLMVASAHAEDAGLEGKMAGFMKDILDSLIYRVTTEESRKTIREKITRGLYRGYEPGPFVGESPLHVQKRRHGWIDLYLSTAFPRAGNAVRSEARPVAVVIEKTQPSAGMDAQRSAPVQVSVAGKSQPAAISLSASVPAQPSVTPTAVSAAAPARVGPAVPGAPRGGVEVGASSLTRRAALQLSGGLIAALRGLGKGSSAPAPGVHPMTMEEIQTLNQAHSGWAEWMEYLRAEDGGSLWHLVKEVDLPQLLQLRTQALTVIRKNQAIREPLGKVFNEQEQELRGLLTTLRKTPLVPGSEPDSDGPLIQRTLQILLDHPDQAGTWDRYLRSVEVLREMGVPESSDPRAVLDFWQALPSAPLSPEELARKIEDRFLTAFVQRGTKLLQTRMEGLGITGVKAEAMVQKHFLDSLKEVLRSPDPVDAWNETGLSFAMDHADSGEHVLGHVYHREFNLDQHVLEHVHYEQFNLALEAAQEKLKSEFGEEAVQIPFDEIWESANGAFRPLSHVEGIYQEHRLESLRNRAARVLGDHLEITTGQRPHPNTMRYQVGYADEGKLRRAMSDPAGFLEAEKVSARREAETETVRRESYTRQTRRLLERLAQETAWSDVELVAHTDLDETFHRIYWRPLKNPAQVHELSGEERGGLDRENFLNGTRSGLQYHWILGRGVTAERIRSFMDGEDWLRHHEDSQGVVRIPKLSPPLALPAGEEVREQPGDSALPAVPPAATLRSEMRDAGEIQEILEGHGVDDDVARELDIPKTGLAILERFGVANRNAGGGTLAAQTRVAAELTDGIVSLWAYCFNKAEELIKLLPPALAQKANNVLTKMRVVVARKMLGIKTIQAEDAFLLGREFALRQGFLAAVRDILGDKPVAVIARDAKDRVLVDEYNSKLAPDMRVIVASESDIGEAMNILRSKAGPRRQLKALLYAGETLKNQPSDITIQRITQRMLQNFLRLAGADVAERMARMVEEFLATSRSA